MTVAMAASRASSLSFSGPNTSGASQMARRASAWILSEAAV